MRREWAPALAVAALGAALRLFGLGDVYPVDDEYFQFFEALRPASLPAFFELIRENPHHVLLDLLCSWLLGRVSGQTWWLRLPAFLAGAAAPLVVWRLARPLGRRRALLAALLAAISLQHVDWSRRVDFYAALTLLAGVQSLLFLRLIERPRAWPAYAFSAAVFLHTHPYAVLHPVLHGLYAALLAPPQRRKELWLAGVKAWGLAGLAFSPWFIFSTSRLIDLGTFDLVGAPGTLDPLQFLARAPLVLGQAPEAGPYRLWQLSATSLVSAAMLAAYALSLARLLRAGAASHALRLAHLSLPLGTAAVMGFDWLYQYYFSPHQLLWLLPSYLVAVADGIAAASERLAPRRPAAAAGAAAAALLALVLPAYWEVTAFQRQMTRRTLEIADAVARHGEAGDELRFQNEHLLMNFLYFFDREAFRGAGTLRLKSGFLSWVLPDEGVAARRGGKAFRALPPRGPPNAARGGVWRFEGHAYEMRVRPPERTLGRNPGR